MSTQGRIKLFNDWAGHYDKSVQSDSVFPFDGYSRILAEITECAAVQPGMSILDLGTGTGNLAERFAAIGCTVWGVDS
jgi:ubiquinone/menaquinone biosynthesis C-methylase UbiE